MLKITSLIALIVFFLPYTSCLVISIGFPLKIYEILGIFLLATILTKQKFILKVNSQERRVYVWLMLFFCWYCLAGIASFWTLSEITVPRWAVGRHAPFISVITKLLYFFLNIFLFYIVVCFISKKQLLVKIIKIWIASSSVAAIYSLYLFIFSLLDIKPIFLPGTEFPMQYAVLPIIGDFIRNGTFKEGNYLGGYLVVSMMITLPFLLYRSESTSVLSKMLVCFVFVLQLGALLISSSTINIIAFIIGLIVFLKMAFLPEFKIKRKFIYPLCFTVLFGLLFLFSPYSKLIIFERIFGSDPYWSFSRRDRIESIKTALNMAYHNPIFGVGPTNYGFFYDLYKPSDLFDGTKAKRITNNIYAEILSESGVVGFLLFLMFILSLMKLYLTKKKSIDDKLIPILQGLFCGFICMLITFTAFPTFTLTFHWILMGLLTCALKIKRQQEAI